MDIQKFINDRMEGDMRRLSNTLLEVFKEAVETAQSLHAAHTYIVNLTSMLVSKTLSIYISSATGKEMDAVHGPVYTEIQLLLKRVLERHVPGRASFMIEIPREGTEKTPLGSRMCPTCKHVHFDGYSKASATVNCVACGEYLVIDAEGRLELMPEDTYRRLPVETKDEMMKVREAILLLKKHGVGAGASAGGAS